MPIEDAFGDAPITALTTPTKTPDMLVPSPSSSSLDPLQRILITMPKSMQELIDERAASIGAGRREWIRRALWWALSQPNPTTSREYVEEF